MQNYYENKVMKMRGELDLEEASGRLYTKDVVIQDCNAYIKQVK